MPELDLELLDKLVDEAFENGPVPCIDEEVLFWGSLALRRLSSPDRLARRYLLE